MDPVYGGLFLKINGLAPIGAILNYKSREKAVVIKGPVDDDISASTVRMLTNQNGYSYVDRETVTGSGKHRLYCAG